MRGVWWRANTWIILGVATGLDTGHPGHATPTPRGIWTEPVMAVRCALYSKIQIVYLFSDIAHAFASFVTSKRIQNYL